MMSLSIKASLPLSRCVAYASPHFTACWLIASMAVVKGVYAKYYGLPLATIAGIVLIASLFDAITDPLIGYYNDRQYNRTGTRKPFMLLGAPMFIFGAYFLYLPPSEVGPFYFGCAYIALFLGWTLFEVPHIALAGDIAPNTTDKTLIYSIRNMAFYGGKICFYMVPLLPIFESHAFTPETLKVSFFTAGLLMLPLLLICLKSTPGSYIPKSNSSELPSSSSILIAQQRKNLLQLWQSVSKNSPFILFVCAYALNGIASGMWYSLAFIFVDIYLGMGEQYAQLFTIAFILGLVSSPLWHKIAVRLGKKLTWVMATILLLFSYGYTATLTPGDTAFWQLLLLKGSQTCGFSCQAVVGPALLSEISDYNTWKFKEDRTATFFALHTFNVKTTVATAVTAGLGLAAWYGFDATASTQSEHAEWGLFLAMSWIPMVFASMALAFMYLIPINARRHAIIRKSLEARKIRTEPRAPSSS